MELWKVVPPGAREVPPGGLCPACRSPRVRRRRAKGGWEAALRAVGPWRPFVCAACKWSGWAWPEPSEGIIQPVPDLQPSRRRHRLRNSHGKVVLTPIQILAKRRRGQLAIAIAVAALTGGALLRCQQEEGVEASSQP